MTSIDDRSALREAVSLRIDHIVLVSSTPSDTTAVAGLSLLVDDEGITVASNPPAPARTVAWERTTALSFHRPAQLPDGGVATLLELGVGDRAIHFLVPADSVAPEDAPALQARMAGLALRRGVALAPPPPPPAPPAPLPPPTPEPAEPAETPATVPSPPVSLASPAIPPPPAVPYEARRQMRPAEPPPPMFGPSAAPTPSAAPAALVGPVIGPFTSHGAGHSASGAAAPAPPLFQAPAAPMFLSPAAPVAAPLPPPPVAAYTPAPVDASAWAYGATAATPGSGGGLSDAISVGRRGGHRPRRRALWVVAAVIVLAGMGGGGGWYLVNRSRAATVNVADLRLLASGVNLQLTDLPPNWQTDRSATNVPDPFAGAQGKAKGDALAEQLARCTGMPQSEAQQMMSGQASAGEVDESSPSFTDTPSGGVDVSSDADVLPSASSVASDLKVVTEPQFPSCAQEVVVPLASAAVPASITVSAGGAPTVSPLPTVAGVEGTIVSVPIVIRGSAGPVTTYLEQAYIASGRVESDVISFTAGAPLDQSLFDGLVQTVEARTAVVAKQIADNDVTGVTDA